MVVILERRTTSTDYGPSHRADGKPLTLITRYLVLKSYRKTVNSGYSWRRGSRQSEN